MKKTETYESRIPSNITDPVERDFQKNRLRIETKQDKKNNEFHGRLLNIETFLNGLKIKKGNIILTFIKNDVKEGNYEI